MSGQKIPIDKVRQEVFCGDSWFTNYRTLEAMWLNGYHYVGQVKTGHHKVPKEFLEDEMASFCPGSWLVLQHTSPRGTPMICIGYKYNRKRVLTFLMTMGCGSTTSGKGYETSYTQEDNEQVNKTISHPDVITKYFNAAGVIDQHNHNRQGTLQLENKWVTQCGYYGIFTTIIGMVATASWLSYHFFLDEQEQLKQERGGC